MAKAEDDGLIRHSLLGWVALDMAHIDAGKQIKLGFMSCIGQFAAMAREVHGDGFYRQYLAEANAALDAMFASAKATRSEHARKAAQARWAKAKAS